MEDDRRTLLSVAGLVLIGLIAIGAIVLSNQVLRDYRLDLTEDRLFTLSDGTKAVIQQIEEPITLRFYFSERLARELPSIGLYARRVQDLLEEYASHSNGKIRLEVYNPEPFTEAEDRAVAAGLQGVPVDQSGELVYFGLSGTNAIDYQQSIPFFDQQREPLLEYDITQMAYILANPDKTKVALLDGIGMSGDPRARMMADAPDTSWAAYQQIKDQYDIQDLGGSPAAIPEDIEVLLIVHPKAISEGTRYAIDQYVLRGGKVAAFLDPHSEVDVASPRPGPPTDPDTAHSNLPGLLKAWGVEMPDGEAVGDLANARRVQVPVDAGPAGPSERATTRVAAVGFPLWMTIGAPELAESDPVTAGLSALNLASPGHFVMSGQETTTVTPLIQTSEQGGLVAIDQVRQGQQAVLSIANSFVPTGRYTLAVRIDGPVATAFPDGPPKPLALVSAEQAAASATSDADRKAKQVDVENEERAWEAAKARHRATSERPANLILVADADMLADGMWVRVQDFFGQRVAVPTAQNGYLLANILENLSGSADLISLRSRGVLQRPFTLVQSLQRDAERQFRSTEQELLQKLTEAEARLRELQEQGSAQDTVVISNEQRAEIDRFRGEVVALRTQLRDVQYKLREDVEQMSMWIKALNIVAVPLLVVIVAISIAVARSRSRRRRHMIA